MAARQLSLFDCYEMNPYKKRRTESGNTEPESSKPRGDVEKPEGRQYQYQLVQKCYWVQVLQTILRGVPHAFC